MRRHIFWAAHAFVAAFVPHSIPAVAAESITLTDAVQSTWSRAPQLAAQKSQAGLATLDRWRRFLPNEPQLQYADTDDRTDVSYGVSETIGFPGKVLASVHFDKARQERERAEWAAKRYEVARLVIQSYVDTAVSQELVASQRKSLDDVESLAHALRVRYESGLATQAEDIGIQLQFRQQRADLAADEDHLAVAADHLKSLLGFPLGADATLVLPDDLNAGLLAELGGLTADEARARADVELAQSGRALAVWNQLPDINLGVSRNHYLYLPGSPSGKPRTTNYTVGFTVPILFPFYEAPEALRARNQAVIDQSAAELAVLEAETARRGAAREYARNRDRLKEVREKDIPLAEAFMESTFSAYKTGKLSFAELMLARKTLADLRAQDIQLRGAVINAHLGCLEIEGDKR